MSKIQIQSALKAQGYSLCGRKGDYEIVLNWCGKTMFADGDLAEIADWCNCNL
jgi:hypothetical protein